MLVILKCDPLCFSLALGRSPFFSLAIAQNAQAYYEGLDKINGAHNNRSPANLARTPR